MEMSLMVKEITVGVTIAFAVGLMSWMCLTLISLDKRSEITSFKVSENYRMIKPLWEDFIQRKGSNDYSSLSNGQTNNHLTFKEE
jgi:hypothetical protein|tara:strand:- start:292 stop:546 length:255 start_codon:yes stop_codon:yes gene_type:complete